MSEANANIHHMMNGGHCLTKKGQKVFQGKNGNFYYEKSKSEIKSFEGLFSHLTKVEESLSGHGMICLVNVANLNSDLKEDETIQIVGQGVDNKGNARTVDGLIVQVISSSAIRDNTPEIEKALCSLNIMDEFDKNKAEQIVELAMDISSHMGKVPFTEEEE